MSDKNLNASQTPSENNAFGSLEIFVTSTQGLIPIPNATITITYTNAPETVIQTLTTNESGQTEIVALPAPPFALSQEPSDIQPYTNYTIEVTAPGYEPVIVSGTEILPDVIALQPIKMIPEEISEAPEEDIFIPEHTLFGNYPPKIPEAEIKPMNETGEIVLSRVVIPEYIIVHDGVPSDSSAPNYYVRYKDYIKNVASCEIYATWPEAAIYANILAIQSFTLNRVYTEW